MIAYGDVHEGNTILRTCFKYINTAQDIGLRGGTRIPDGFRSSQHPCEMNNRIYMSYGFCNSSCIPDVTKN